MRIGNTMMNSLLFNTELILVCSVAVVHFCQRAFDVYTRLTDINQLLGNEVENLRFLKYFFQNNVFIYVLTILAMLSFIWLIVFPKEVKQEFDKDVRARARIRAAATRPRACPACVLRVWLLRASPRIASLLRRAPALTHPRAPLARRA
jgi:hypothetical protein